jgi:hypothetical protein
MARAASNDRTPIMNRSSPERSMYLLRTSSAISGGVSVMAQNCRKNDTSSFAEPSDFSGAGQIISSCPFFGARFREGRRPVQVPTNF